MSYVALQAAALVDLPGVGLSNVATITMFRLAFHHNRQTRKCCPSIRLIAKQGGISERSAWSSIQELEKLGLIRVSASTGSRRRGRPANGYDLMFIASMRREHPAMFAEKDVPTDMFEYLANPDEYVATGATEHRKEQGKEERKEDSPLPPKRDNPAKAATSRRKPETSIPEGFPDVAAMEIAQTMLEAEGVTVNVQREALKFRGHAEAHDRRARDWLAAWRNWVRIAMESAPAAAPVTQAAAAPSNPELHDYIWRTRLDEWTRGRGWKRDPWGPEPGEPGCKAPPELLAIFPPPDFEKLARPTMLRQQGASQ